MCEEKLLIRGKKGYRNFYRDIQRETSGTSTKQLAFGELSQIMGSARRDHSAKVVRRQNNE